MPLNNGETDHEAWDGMRYDIFPETQFHPMFERFFVATFWSLPPFQQFLRLGSLSENETTQCQGLVLVYSFHTSSFQTFHFPQLLPLECDDDGCRMDEVLQGN